MGKSLSEWRNKDKDGETKVLFKKSNAVLFSHSRTLSGVSQSYSRSGIMQIKKNLEHSHNYYEDKGKLKRDLSVETDVCILRRYYRSRKNKLSTRDGSMKSRYSTMVDTEVDTIDEFPDTSACGDNDTENKSHSPLDIASLMIDNLKDLLNQWIQEHLIENKDNKQKIDSVIHSLIEKFDRNKTLTSSSGSTYVLHKETTTHEVKDKKIATPSFTCDYCKQTARTVKVGSTANTDNRESSALTIPFKCKDIRIISTLSIPRSFHKRGMEEHKPLGSSWYKTNKMKHKNVTTLSVDKSHKMINSSSFDLVSISTNTLTKQSTNCDVHVKKKKRHIVFFPKPLYKSATESSSVTNNERTQLNNLRVNKEQLDDMPSLMKSLYTTELNLAGNLDKNVENNTTNDNYTMTEAKSKTINKMATDSNLPNRIYIQQSIEKSIYEGDQRDMVAVDYMKNQQIQFSNIRQSKSLSIRNQATTKRNYKKTSIKGKHNKHKRRLTSKIQQNIKLPENKNIQNKNFTFLYKKANNQKSQIKQFVKYCQNLFDYFEDYETNKNIKLDVRINVLPSYENKTKDVCTDISNQALGVYDVKGGSTLLYNVKPTEVSSPENIDEDSMKSHTENDSSFGFTHEIIPLLDGAASQAKYIFDDSRDKLEGNSKQNIVMERSTLTSELEIAQEISELRAIIKDLTAAADKFVSEQIKRDSNKSNAGTNMSPLISNNFTSSSKVQAVISLRNPSKAVQYSKEFLAQQKLISGVKLSKEPKKKDTFEYYNRLAKKSTSYRIIDSESILRVTDMTSKANEIQHQNKIIEGNSARPLLKKSRSLFELPGDQRNKRKFITLFCDGYQKSIRCNACSIHKKQSEGSRSTCFRRSRRRNKNWFARKKKEKKLSDKSKQLNQQSTNQFSELTSEPTTIVRIPSCTCPTTNGSVDREYVQMLIPEGNSFKYSSTMVFPPRETEEIEIEDEQTINEAQKVRKVRRGMNFGEGCVYCVLLWIPVIMIACLFYVYVLKDKLKSQLEEGKPTSASTGVVIPVPAPGGNSSSSSSVLFVKLRDLGF